MENEETISILAVVLSAIAFVGCIGIGTYVYSNQPEPIDISGINENTLLITLLQKNIDDLESDIDDIDLIYGYDIDEDIQDDIVDIEDDIDDLDDRIDDLEDAPTPQDGEDGIDGKDWSDMSEEEWSCLVEHEWNQTAIMDCIENL